MSKRLQQALCHRLTTQYDNRGDRSFLMSALEILGLGEQVPRLIQTVAQPLKPMVIRATALDLLLQLEPQSIPQIHQVLPPQKFKKLLDYQFLETLESASYDYSGSVAITQCLLTGKKLDIAKVHLDVLDALRPQVGTLASVVYADALRCQDLAFLHPQLLELVRQEGGPVAEMLLTELHNATPDKEQQRVIQTTLMQTLTAATTKPKKTAQPIRATIYMSSCDGQGAFTLVGRFQHTLHKEQTTACLCLWATGEIREADTFPYQSDYLFKQLFEKLGVNAQQTFTRISLEEAASLVYDAYQTTRDNRVPISPGYQVVLALFLKAYNGHRPVHKNRDIKIHFSIEDLRDVFSKHNYQSWFFDADDMETAGVTKPKQGHAKLEWLTQAAKNMASTHLAQRLPAMARHMADWYTLHQDTKQADLFIALADMTEQDFEQSFLVLVMLERTYNMYMHFSLPPPKIVFEYTDDLRDHLRKRFFAKVKNPSSRDLATLDFCETARILLEAPFSRLPAELRPNSALLDKMTYDIAKAFVDSLWKDRDNAELSYQAIAAALSHYTLRISSKGRDSMVYSLENSMRMFVSTCCSRCPIGCLDHPSIQQRAAFFHHAHPLHDFLT